MRKEKKQISEEDIYVKLKPIKGIKPGVYLTVLYGIILLLILFMLLVFPGIRNNGTVYSISSSAGSAAVFADGVYRGTTPVRIFLDKGSHNISIKKKYFTEDNIDVKTGGRIFFSLVFPRKEDITSELKLIEPEKFLEDRYSLISGYALMRDFFDGYQYPRLITETVREYQAGTGKKTDSMLLEFMDAMRFNMGSKELVKDLAASIRLLNGTSEENSDYSVLRDFYTKEGHDTAGIVFAYLSSFPEKNRKDVISGDPLVKEDFGAASKAILPSVYKTEDRGGIYPAVFSGLRFMYVPSGEYTAGIPVKGKSDDIILRDEVLANFPHTEVVNGFYMLDREVTKKEFSQFLKENGQWSRQNLNNLVKKGLVTSDYLMNYGSAGDNDPVQYVSWYAAEAFAEWLSSRLPAEYSNYRAVLPSESQWEWASRLNEETGLSPVLKKQGLDGPLPADSSREGALGLYDMLGNLWEWCSNYYQPADTLFGSYGSGSDSFRGAEKAVRGGSWANDEKEVSSLIRGSQDPSWCTPFLGFRVILVKKAE